MRAGRARRSRRWLRFAVPPAVALLLIGVTLVMHGLQQPDVTDANFLSPDSGAAIGASRLHAMLGARGVEVDRVTNTRDALDLAAGGDATLFVPAPALSRPGYLHAILTLPLSARVVLVAPSARTLMAADIAVTGVGQRWATRAATPDCALPEAVAAGTASVYQLHYGSLAGTGVARCYGGGLIASRPGYATVMLVGANDPFRNDRIGEVGNATLATGLLGAQHRVVWLDLHRAEPPPPTPTELDTPPNGTSTGGDTGTGTGAGTGTGTGGGDTGGGGTQGGGGRGGSKDQQSSATGPNPLWQAFPPGVWAALVLLAVAALLAAATAARRLGAPVPEPLPVTVRPTETVTGRGRLYRRARARDTTLGTLRTAAMRRMRPALGLPPDAGPPEIVSAVAARTGLDPDDVERVLRGTVPHSDRDMVQDVAELDALVAAVTGTDPDTAGMSTRESDDDRTHGRVDRGR